MLEISLLASQLPCLLQAWQSHPTSGSHCCTSCCLLQVIAQRVGKPHPTLGDVAAYSGVEVIIAATSLARRAPVYLSSSSHPDMPVYDALRGSCAIPLLFSPVRAPGGDLLVDGCISDCTPVGALGPGVDMSRVLVLAVHDAAGLEGGDLQVSHDVVVNLACMQT